MDADEALDSPDAVPVGERRCTACGHFEEDHEARDIEGETRKQDYCLACDDWHSFVPIPE